MRKLGIFGGTFNPVHWGHLLMAETALSQLCLDGVIWIPSSIPPHKSNHQLADFRHRAAMLQRAVESRPQFEVSWLEAHRSGLCYAVDTWKALQTEYPASHWYWIIGLDAFQALPRWYQLSEFAADCVWAIAPRLNPTHLAHFLHNPDRLRNLQTAKPTATNPEIQSSSWLISSLLEPFGEHIVSQAAADIHTRYGITLRHEWLHMPLIDVSSDFIRQRCGDRHSIQYLVPDSVREYILEHRLYTAKQI